MAELLDRSPALRRLAWAAVSVPGLYGLAALITAIRWW